MYKEIISIAFTAVIFVSTNSMAQSLNAASYSEDEVVKFMVQQADLGASRAICIGTKQECEASKPAPKGFDMMLTFDLDSANLSQDAKGNLDVIAAALKDDRLKAAKFRVEGHTDARGRDDYNQTLSVNRANAVAQYLEAKNISRERLEAIGLGKSGPRTPDPFDPENRRVELKLSVE